MPASIASPGSDGWAVEFWISGVGGSGSLSKEAFSWNLLLDDRKTLGTMEGLPGNDCGREENGFV